jgi:hypothetical protein
MKITSNGLETIRYMDFNLNMANYSGEIPDQDCVFMFSFQKSIYEYLEVKSTIEDGKILISWNRKISPQVGKTISILTMVLLIVSAIIRLLIPIESIIPMTIFIIGIAGNVVFLLILIYLYDKSLEKNTDEQVSFLESIMFVNDIEKLALRA